MEDTKKDYFHDQTSHSIINTPIAQTDQEFEENRHYTLFSDEKVLNSIKILFPCFVHPLQHTDTITSN